MQIPIFMNSAAGMKSKKRFVSPIKDRNEYYLSDISSHQISLHIVCILCMF